MNQDYTISPARYAKGMMAVSCPGIECSYGKIKSRAGRLASALAGNRYSNREKSYIMSPAKAAKFEQLYAKGWDASVMTGELEAPQMEATEVG